MLQNILKINGVSQLDKTQQKRITGGNPCSNYSGPICFGVALPGCGTCEDFQALPPDVQICVLSSADCIENWW